MCPYPMTPAISAWRPSPKQCERILLTGTNLLQRIDAKHVKRKHADTHRCCASTQKGNEANSGSLGCKLRSRLPNAGFDARTVSDQNAWLENQSVAQE